jgi:hypothetical protein
MALATRPQWHLVVPGLAPGVHDSWLKVDDCPRLLEFLRHAKRLPSLDRSADRALCQLMGKTLSEQQDVPSAALHRLGTGEPVDDAYWLYLSPVNLRVDRDDLILFPLAGSSVDTHLLTVFAEQFNRLVSADGWRLERVGSACYLRAPRPLDLTTVPLDQAAGQAIGKLMPQGRDAPLLRRLMSEAELLLHQILMQAAEGASSTDSTINGWWPWGGGALSQIHVRAYARVISDEPLACGLLKAAQAHNDSSVPGLNSSKQEPWVHDSLCYTETLQRARWFDDRLSWNQGLRLIEDWLKAADEEGALVRLGDPVVWWWSGSTRGQWQWWRARRSLADWLIG